ncbi:hypothetical protein NDU88_007490 [Pleurodeles waltl]|uniref:Reverse transcriptase n=1 Tax=Pleurodeles waltl TaxID=8319 RepID=A0AAV7RSK1_PLEWA|nr:hypothetical protein NDU88_007490 [Pleurodeles waltl]
MCFTYPEDAWTWLHAKGLARSQEGTDEGEEWLISTSRKRSRKRSKGQPTEKQAAEERARVLKETPLLTQNSFEALRATPEDSLETDAASTDSTITDVLKGREHPFLFAIRKCILRVGSDSQNAFLHTGEAFAPRKQRFSPFASRKTLLHLALNDLSTNSRAVEWDAHKAVIRGHCISTTWGVRHTLHVEISKLEKELRAVEIAVARSETPYRALKEARTKYNEADTRLRRYDRNYHLMRLQTEGDRSGRLLVWLLREDWQQSPIGAIRAGASTMATTQDEINETFREYYANLYTKCTSCTIQELESFLAGSSLSQLSQADRETLEASLTMGKLDLALAQMPRNKAPGTDGLPIEYYTTYSARLKPHLLKVFEEAWANKILPPTQ